MFRNHPHSIYIYPEQPHPSSTHCKNKEKLVSVMVIGLMRKKGEKILDSNLGPLNSRQGPYNYTTMYMVSGHHSNMFSLISPYQRRQSKSPGVKSLVLIHSACPYKNYAPKYSQPPPSVNYFSYLVCNYLVCNFLLICHLSCRSMWCTYSQLAQETFSVSLLR